MGRKKERKREREKERKRERDPEDEEKESKRAAVEYLAAAGMAASDEASPALQTQCKGEKRNFSMPTGREKGAMAIDRRRAFM